MKVRYLLNAVFTIGLFYSSAAFSQVGALNVQIPSEGITLTYPKEVRLEQVLTDTAAHSKVSSPFAYPIANQLFNIDKREDITELKSSVLNRLTTLRSSHPKLHQSISMLVEQIKRWDIGYREHLNLDFDAIRLDPSLNPMLAGNYELLLPSRKSSVLVEGLVFNPATFSLNKATSVSEVINQANRLSSSSSSFAWVIYPDGSAQKVGYAYWNDSKTLLAPGSSIFIGFDKTGSDFKQLEHDIVKLISMRKNL
ncbi:capsule biosynthesis GfcC family protein [Vibrio mexicanus]|uniref:capsule biosynthesis GfcC family protein n=1 Tax=Vibrio mexicanus TaxID=1004326 RepID=UPI00063CC1B8|nr:capsule biosynthesis GfcC family protein [Vibrio mexicanus]